MRQMVLEISPCQSQEFEQDRRRHFVDFEPRFQLNMTSQTQILQDIEKMKAQYLRSLLFNLFEILQAVRSEQTNFA